MDIFPSKEIYKFFSKLKEFNALLEN